MSPVCHPCLCAIPNNGEGVARCVSVSGIGLKLGAHQQSHYPSQLSPVADAVAVAHPHGVRVAVAHPDAVADAHPHHCRVLRPRWAHSVHPLLPTKILAATPQHMVLVYRCGHKKDANV